MYEQILNAAGSALGGSDSGGGGGGSYGNPHDAVSGAPVTVAPVGINLGSVLSTYQDGNPQTGGYGAQFISRLGFGDPATTAAIQQVGPSLILLFGGAVVAYILVKTIKFKG